MSTTVSEPIITWEKLPDDFLRDDPVDNINQPLLAAALIEPGTGRTHSAVNAYH